MENEIKKEEIITVSTPVEPRPNWRNFYKNKRYWLPLLGWVVLLAIGYFMANRFPEYFNIKTDYVQAYTLVNDKISQSAVIIINVPPKLTKEEIQGGIRITPEVKGNWLDNSGNTKQLFFKPTTKLELGKYYTVIASTTQGLISKDFLVDEDPRVISVFPRTDSEAHEKTNITIAFNRPMVVLSFLDQMINKNVPVEITPFTAGKYKWISTRTLQFIPATSLIASANYTVKVKSDFSSQDGLNISEFEHKFVTRPLRYNNFDDQAVVFNKPFIVSFNQPVDLDRTREEISVSASSSEDKIDFIAEYGQSTVYNREKNKNEKVTDESIIYIYNKTDKFSRTKNWNFNTDYHIKINKAYPKAGDINLEESHDSYFHIGEIVESITGKSDRTDFSSLNLFDPQGKLVLNFYEDIDLGASDVKSEKLIKTEYGQKCQGDEPNQYYSSEVECEKVDDKSTILLTLDNKKITIGEKLTLELKKIITVDGIKLNSETITKEINVYNQLQFIKTEPTDNDKNADLTKLTICTNNPISTPAKEDNKKYLSANLDFEIQSWDKSFLVDEFTDRTSTICPINSFDTHIWVGLMPESDYQFSLKPIDDFGQTVEKKISFRTGKMPTKFLNFYHFQDYYSVTTPNKTRLTYAAENMDYIDINICQLSAKDMLYYLNNKPDYWVGPSAISGCLESVNTRIDLPKKYWIKNYLHFDLKDYIKNPLGQYVVTITNPNYYDRSNTPKRVYERNYITVTNLSVVEKRTKIWNENNPDIDLSKKNLDKVKNIYWVTSIGNLNPVVGAKVSLYSGKDDNGKSILSLAGVYSTNNEGLAITPAASQVYGLAVENGNDSAIISDVIDNFGYASNAQTAQAIYLYTDKPIYRPGQTVDFKGLYRVGFDGDYEIFRDKKIPVIVYNAENTEIYKTELDVNDFGTFNGEFVLPPDSPLGSYRIEAKENGGYAYFDVEEYKGAAFKLETKTDKEEYISAETFNLDINASYYFGAPVDSGDVEYSITSQDYYFDKYQDEYFSFGRPWYSCYDNCYYGDKFILRDQAKLDSLGHASISRQLDITKLFKNVEERNSKIFTVFVTVKNSNGQSVSGQQSFIVHAGNYYFGLKTDKDFLAKNESFPVRVKSVDTVGKPLSANDLTLKLNKINWVYAKRQEVDGGYYYQWERKLEEVKLEKISTDDKGNWSGTMSIDKEGEYELYLSGSDKNGNLITSIYGLYIYGDGQVEVKPTNDTSLELVTDKNSLEVGDNASFIIKSPYEHASALVSIERGQIYEYKIINIDSNLYKYEFKVDKKYVPNIFVSVVLISPKPEVKYGSLSWNISAKPQELNVEIKSDKDFYLPGEDVKLKFSAKDSDGQPVETEFSAAVVDMSVLALKGNPKKDPLVFFYSGFPLTVSTVSNLKNILFEADVPYGTKGGGGNDPADLARKKRGIFKETAFWNAVIKTDKTGIADVTFKLPDNLTTWQAESVGITKDTKIGVAYKEFTSRKEIMAVPLAPRFIVPGDQFYIGATIFNQTATNQNLKISIVSSTLTLPKQLIQEVSIDAGKSKTIYFQVSAPISMREGDHIFTISASNQTYDDTVESTIPVKRNQTAEVVATADNSTNSSLTEYVYVPAVAEKDRGELTINISASLASFLLAGLNSIIANVYDYNDDIISKLEAVAVFKQALSIKGLDKDFKFGDINFDNKKLTPEQFVEQGINRLYANYRQEGFTYYAGGVPDFYLSIEAMHAMSELKKADYKINEDFFSELYQSLNDRINYDQTLQEDSTQQILAVYALVKVQGKDPINKVLVNKVKAMEKNDKLLNERLGHISLAYLATLLSDQPNIFSASFKNKVYKILENRIEIDSRGAFLAPGDNYIWQFYETPINDTALALLALVKDKKGQDINDRLLRWLVRSRYSDGAWGSNANTIAVVRAMTEFIKWTGENEPNFSLELSLNNVVKNNSTFTIDNFANDYSMLLPIQELPFETINSINFKKNEFNDKTNRFYYDISLRYYLPVDQIAPRDEGFAINRKFYAQADQDNKNEITITKVGDIVRGHLEIIVPKQRNFVSIEDFIPAGFELVNFNLNTENQALLINENNTTPDWQKEWYDANIKLWPDKIENRDDRLRLFKQNLYSGTYEYDYYLRALVPGTFHHLPAQVSENYFPENFGRTNGDYFTITK